MRQWAYFTRRLFSSNILCDQRPWWRYAPYWVPFDL